MEVLAGTLVVESVRDLVSYDSSDGSVVDGFGEGTGEDGRLEDASGEGWKGEGSVSHTYGIYLENYKKRWETRFARFLKHTDRVPLWRVEGIDDCSGSVELELVEGLAELSEVLREGDIFMM